jgi:hypothetical protein
MNIQLPDQYTAKSSDVPKISILITPTPTTHEFSILVYVGAYSELFKEDFQLSFTLNSDAKTITNLTHRNQSFITLINSSTSVRLPLPLLYRHIDIIGADALGGMQSFILSKLHTTHGPFLVTLTQNNEFQIENQWHGPTGKILKAPTHSGVYNNAVHKKHLKGEGIKDIRVSQLPSNKKRRLPSRVLSLQTKHDHKIVKEIYEKDTVTAKNGVALFEGEHVARDLLAHHGDQTFSNGIVSYIRNFAHVNQQTTLFYQSLYLLNDSRKLHSSALPEGASAMLKDSSLLMQELDALYTLLHIYKFKDIRFVIPFIRTPLEVEKLKELIRKKQLTRSVNFKIYVAIQIPSALFLIDAILDQGIDGVVIDVPKLAQRLLGLDMDEGDSVVKEYLYDKSVQNAIKTCLQQVSMRKLHALIILPEHGQAKLLDAIPEIKNHVISITKTNKTTDKENISEERGRRRGIAYL